MEECIFCKISKGEIPSMKVYEADDALAFLDINPRNKGHTLVIPKRHYETVMEMPDEEVGELFKTVKKIAMAVKEGVEASGVNISQNNGKAAGQVVPHVHFHVIPRFETDQVKAGSEALLPPVKVEEAEMNEIRKKISENVPEGAKEAPKEKPIETEQANEEPEEAEETGEDFKRIDFNF